MQIHRPSNWLAIPILAAILVAPPALRADEVSGIVKSVDLEGKKFVVTPNGKDSAVDVVVNDKTIMKNEAGEEIALKELKAGDGVGVVSKAGIALNVLVAVKPSELTGHVKSVGANLKTFVVTETGTSTDVTVAVNPGTAIVTTDGKKIELKELKKGDGVGIAHTNSLASKIVVSVKPIEKETR